jgi:DNA-binding PucR family transcriptional regulator
VLVPVAHELDANAAALSVAAVEHIREQIPVLFGDPASVEENRASTEAGIRAFAALVSGGADPATIELPAATVAYAQASVRRGDSLPALMRSYRLAVEVAWQAILERIAAHSDDAAGLLVATQLASAWLFAYMDVALTLAEELYDRERSRWLRSAAASQAETIEAVLEGRQRDLGQASARLRYELDRHHLAAVAWLDGAEDGDSLAHLEAAIGQLAAGMGADAVLVQPLGLLAAAAWLGRVTPFAADLGGLRLDPGAAPGVRVALGEPAAGIAGFRSSRAEAGHARRVAALAGRRPGTITRFGRVALVAMATTDVDQARAFVARELGPLAAEDDDVARRLAATLRAYLEDNASRSRTAKRLGIHENTVSYRVRQAEELLGRSVEERTLELRVALALLGMVPGD